MASTASSCESLPDRQSKTFDIIDCGEALEGSIPSNVNGKVALVKRGGDIVAFGSPKEIMKNKNSITGKFLSGKETIEIPKKRRKSKNTNVTYC